MLEHPNNSYRFDNINKKEASLILAELFPNKKMDEIELLAAITTKKELDAYLKQLGREK